MVKYGGGALRCFLNLSPKVLADFTYVLPLKIHKITLEPVDYPNFLCDLIPVFWGHQEVPDGVFSFKVYLNLHLTTCLLEAFAKPLGVRDHYIDVAVPVIFLVSVMVVLGLIDSMSVVDVGQKFV